eukprot:Platyproteum_vivax@DN5974_c0_g1_i1.p1
MINKGRASCLPRCWFNTPRCWFSTLRYGSNRVEYLEEAEQIANYRNILAYLVKSNSKKVEDWESAIQHLLRLRNDWTPSNIAWMCHLINQGRRNRGGISPLNSQLENETQQSIVWGLKKTYHQNDWTPKNTTMLLTGIHHWFRSPESIDCLLRKALVLKNSFSSMDIYAVASVVSEAHVETKLQKEVVSALIDLCAVQMNRFNSLELSNTFNKLSQCGQVIELLPDRFVSQLHAVVPVVMEHEETARNLVRVLHSMGNFKMLESIKLVEFLAERLLTIKQDFTIQDCCNIMTSLQKLNMFQMTTQTYSFELACLVCNRVSLTLPHALPDHIAALISSVSYFSIVAQDLNQGSIVASLANHVLSCCIQKAEKMVLATSQLSQSQQNGWSQPDAVKVLAAIASANICDGKGVAYQVIKNMLLDYEKFGRHSKHHVYNPNMPKFLLDEITVIFAILKLELLGYDGMMQLDEQMELPQHIERFWRYMAEIENLIAVRRLSPYVATKLAMCIVLICHGFPVYKNRQYGYRIGQMVFSLLKYSIDDFESMGMIEWTPWLQLLYSVSLKLVSNTSIESVLRRLNVRNIRLLQQRVIQFNKPKYGQELAKVSNFHKGVGAVLDNIFDGTYNSEKWVGPYQVDLICFSKVNK